MTHEPALLLLPAIFGIALLYSTVGHAGASGYIAVMVLAGVQPAILKPTALALNIAVACLGTFQFSRAGHFSWRLFWPFALLSVPAAFLGGYVALPTRAFKMLVGAVLLYSAARFLLRPQEADAVRPPAFAAALPTGAGLGLLSGLTGTGGGIFLTPLMILMRWAHTKTAAGVSAAFILVNSIAGLAGHISGTRLVPTPALPLLGAAILGGAVGSHLGSRRLPAPAVKRLLAAVLIIAGCKLLFTK